MAKFISLFSGCGGIDLGMEQAGHECVAQVEWDKNAAGVLKHRWPNVPLFCDVSKVSADDLPDADFITYGFPCQDLSVAGKREGLDGKRSGLFYEATRLIRELRTRGCGLRFSLAENVRGLLSADDGLALARCIRELLDCGASEVGFRILDSQYFGVAQRRKRVFIVSDFGGESCDEILAITESLPGHPAPSREAGKGTAGDATKGVGEGGAFSDGSQTSSSLTTRCHNQFMPDKGNFCAVIQNKNTQAYNVTMCDSNGTRKDRPDDGMYVNETDSANTLTTSEKDKLLIAQEGTVFGCDLSQKAEGIGYTKEVAPCIAPGTHAGHGSHVVSWNGDTTPKTSEDVSVTLRSQQGGEGVGVAHVAPTLSASNNPSRSPQSSEVTAQVKAVHDATLTVRRLTPIECERLQGFPDNWTAEKMELILEGNEWKATDKVVKQADGPRYKQMGNAVTVNVAEWIGKQIGKVLNETK
jgi:DNA (cytosine-5)-methyltransferase 1